jgi:hypothetical protein
MALFVSKLCLFRDGRLLNAVSAGWPEEGCPVPSVIVRALGRPTSRVADRRGGTEDGTPGLGRDAGTGTGHRLGRDTGWDGTPGVGRDTGSGTGHREWDGTPGLGRDDGTGTGRRDWDGTPGLGRDTGTGAGRRDWGGTPGLGRDTGLCTTEPFCTTERLAAQRNEPAAQNSDGCTKSLNCESHLRDGSATSCIRRRGRLGSHTSPAIVRWIDRDESGMGFRPRALLPGGYRPRCPKQHFLANALAWASVLFRDSQRRRVASGLRLGRVSSVRRSCRDCTGSGLESASALGLYWEGRAGHRDWDGTPGFAQQTPSCTKARTAAQKVVGRP